MINLLFFVCQSVYSAFYSLKNSSRHSERDASGRMMTHIQAESKIKCDELYAVATDIQSLVIQNASGMQAFSTSFRVHAFCLH